LNHYPGFGGVANIVPPEKIATSSPPGEKKGEFLELPLIINPAKRFIPYKKA
jgi:hypothetical protein